MTNMTSNTTSNTTRIYKSDIGEYLCVVTRGRDGRMFVARGAFGPYIWSALYNIPSTWTRVA